MVKEKHFFSSRQSLTLMLFKMLYLIEIYMKYVDESAEMDLFEFDKSDEMYLDGKFNPLKSIF
jgi:hypothetical protein